MHKRLLIGVQSNDGHSSLVLRAVRHYHGDHQKRDPLICEEYMEKRGCTWVFINDYGSGVSLHTPDDVLTNASALRFGHSSHYLPASLRPSKII